MTRLELFRLWQLMATPTTFELRITQMFQALDPADQTTLVNGLKADVTAIITATKDEKAAVAQAELDRISGVS